MQQSEEFWSRCQRARPDEPLGDRYSVRRIGNAPAICETILGLITSGEKTGAFSRPEELAAAGLTPHAGDYVMLTDFNGKPRCVVQMQECRLLKFSDISAEHTATESPAARDLETWRGIHRSYWTPALAAEGREFNDDYPVLFQRFRLVFAEAP